MEDVGSIAAAVSVFRDDVIWQLLAGVITSVPYMTADSFVLAVIIVGVVCRTVDVTGRSVRGDDAPAVKWKVN